MAPKKTQARKTEKRDITAEQYGHLAGWFHPPALSGVTVNESTALGLSAVWCGLRTISQDVGTLPPILYQETTGAVRTPARSHPLFRLLRDTPNPDMTRPVFWETMQSHALLWGNCYAEIERDGSGRPLALWPIHPGNVELYLDQGGKRRYRVTIENSTADLNPEDVYHVPGLSPDGTVGYQLLSVARETLGFGIATQQFGASYFGNSARPSGALKVAGTLSDPARENLRKSWSQLHSGPAKAGKIAILEEGLDFAPFQATNEQAQYKDILQFFVYEVARLFNISPTKLFDLAKATWGNLVEANRDYLTTTLRPWLCKHEAEAERKLLNEEERDGLYIEFDSTKLLRADTITRYQSYAIGIGAGFLTEDEVRAEENLPPLPKPEPVPTAVQPGDQQPDQEQPDQAAAVVPEGAAPVADTAMNGAQVASLMAICDKVAAKLYPIEAAKLLIKAAFPLLTDETINAFVNSLATAETPNNQEQDEPGTPVGIEQVQQ